MLTSTAGGPGTTSINLGQTRVLVGTIELGEVRPANPEFDASDPVHQTSRNISNLCKQWSSNNKCAEKRSAQGPEPEDAR